VSGATPNRARQALAGLVGSLLLATLSLSACNEVEETTAEPYEPAHLSEADESGVKTVTLTEPATLRIELETAPIQLRDKRFTVPYEALIYDGKGESWVYIVVGKLAYRRAAVTVVEVENDTVIMSKAPRVGTQVVTQGAMQVHGAELEMAGKH
jgi:hypothetical protein